ncbi:dihydrolipoamide dehydrogenase [Microcella alkaliphila]|uniref:Dihydrolipoyl dehydrogenase n=1 Tax=Microcella alkaliphila TaxID=279828 RepID=A0A4Q7TGA9_9MICO|nr:dihydrolipoyl dehydrogenase [Microcella alkaliphila]RZT59516.1 dihydrolipoamide dehydrogenase [Microcella alkaliphila]
MTQHYDLVVLGAGPGGYVAAIRASQLGLSVAIVERRYWGGVCLNVGCVPTKALLRNAEIGYLVTREAARFGISGDISIDYSAAFERSRSVADGRTAGVHYLMKKNGVVEYEASGIYQDAHTMSIVRDTGEPETITFDATIIATGSTTRLLPGVTLGERVVTYESLILEPTAPQSIVIVGGGAIGLEFAYLLRAYDTEVTVVEYADRLLPNEDADVSAEVHKQFRKLGCTVVTSARVDSAETVGDVAVVRYTDAAGSRLTVEAERALIAVGFDPNLDGYGLDNLGVELRERGGIAVDDRMRTSVDGVYAIGDVTALLQLAHVAEAQGIVAAETIGGAETLPIDDYRFMPRATYFQPQVASFGLTEAQARESGRELRVTTFPFAANAKAHVLGDASGFVKLIADAEFGELLGAHIVGHDASELLPELTLGHQWELTSRELSRNVHAHPGLGEALQEAFHGLEGHTINM